MRDIVIVSGARTPVGSFGGALKNEPVVALGALVLRETLKRAGLRPVAMGRWSQRPPPRLRIP